MSNTSIIPVRRSALFPGYSVTATGAYVDSPQYNGANDQAHEAARAQALRDRGLESSGGDTPRPNRLSSSFSGGF